MADPYTPADTVRAHIQELITEHGVSPTGIANCAGINPKTVLTITQGKRKVRQSVHDAIMAVTVDDLEPSTWVGAGPTVNMVTEMYEHGATYARIHRTTGIDVYALVRDYNNQHSTRGKRVMVRTAHRIRDYYKSGEWRGPDTYAPDPRTLREPTPCKGCGQLLVFNVKDRTASCAVHHARTRCRPCYWQWLCESKGKTPTRRRNYDPSPDLDASPGLANYMARRRERLARLARIQAMNKGAAA